MKRILSLFMVIVMVCLLSVAVFAEGEATDVNENVDAPTEEVVPEASIEEPPAPEDHSVFTRLWEYVIKNKDTVFDIALSTLFLILLLLFKAFKKRLITKLTESNNNSANVANSQIAVTGAVNTLIDAYNALKTAFDKFEKSETERDKQIAALTVATMANLEILSRVYPNSKNLPQGTKNLVNMTYANAMTAINDDAQLAALVNASKNMLAAGTENTASEEETEVSV